MKRVKNEDAVKTLGADLSVKPDQTVIVWKATRPLTVHEHEDLSDKLRSEAEKTGLDIVLVPFSVEQVIDPAAAPVDNAPPSGEPAAASGDPAANPTVPADPGDPADANAATDQASTSAPATAPAADPVGDKK